MNDLIGTIPQWISAAGIVSFLGLFVKWQLGIRKLSVDAQEVNVSAQTARNADTADIRDHYAQELARLTKAINEITADHEQCKRERDQYRREVQELDRKLTGVVRQFVAFQLETAKAIPPENLTPSIRGMLEQLDQLASGNTR